MKFVHVVKEIKKIKVQYDIDSRRCGCFEWKYSDWDDKSRALEKGLRIAAGLSPYSRRSR